MKKSISLALFLLIGITCFAQVKIHSHNDYLQQEPFFTAYQNKVFEIEADVFLVGDSLVVAHSRKEIDQKNTLGKIYLNPIAALFAKNNGKVYPNKNLPFALMIDVKDEWDKVYPVLKKEIDKYGSVFKKNKSKYSIQVIISGNRPSNSTFHSYPRWLFFDGLPAVKYPVRDFPRVALISDNFKKHSSWSGFGDVFSDDLVKLKNIIKEANDKGKLFRFWGAPDTKDCWKLLNSLGKVIINTDKIEECKTYFVNKNEL